MLVNQECKHSQDAEDKFPVQHFYPSFPFVSPFFYNTPLTNLYCPHNPAPETPAKEQQKQQQQGHEPGNVLHQKEKSFRSGNGTEDEETPKNNNVPGPEALCYGHPWCFLNANCPAPPGPVCGCGDSLPWTCSSFIVPMITHCVIWNSRKPNVTTPFGNSPEACQQNKAGEPDTSTDLSQATSQTNNNPTQIEDKCLVFREVTNIEWTHQVGVEESRSFKSLPSSFDKESGYDNTEDNSEKNELHMDGGSDDSEEDEVEEDCETDDWADEDKNEQEETTNVHFSNELQSFVKPVTSAPGSYTDLKQLERSTTPEAGDNCTDMKSNPPDSIAEGEKAFRSGITNHSVQEKIDRQKAHIRQGMCIKKFINNFTMTDQTNCAPEAAQSSAAAAGDLGGVNCIGYRINVANCFDDREFEILKGTETVRNMKPKEIYVKDASHPEEEHNSPKISDKTTKNVKHFRSGIAKLLTNPKLKDSKVDAGKNTKTETRKQVQSEPAVGKWKYHCSVDTTTGTTAQKLKNHRPTQGGPEKQHQQIKTKTETPRKEENNSKPKITKDVVKK